MTNYNIYFGTIGKTLGVKYRYTTNCDSDSEAKKIAYKGAELLYYGNEGKFGIPNFVTINNEAKLTGKSIEQLYQDHIYDMCRWYAIPTKVDSISKKNLRYK